jgi:hypothetical protein
VPILTILYSLYCTHYTPSAVPSSLLQRLSRYSTSCTQYTVHRVCTYAKVQSTQYSIHPYTIHHTPYAVHHTLKFYTTPTYQSIRCTWVISINLSVGDFFFGEKSIRLVLCKLYLACRMQQPSQHGTQNSRGLRLWRCLLTRCRDTVFTIHYTHYTLYSLYTVLTIHCTHYTLYSLYTVLTIHCTHTLYSLYTVLTHCTHTMYSHTVLTIHCTHTLYSLYTVLTHYTHTLYSHTMYSHTVLTHCEGIFDAMQRREKASRWV